MQPQSQSPAAGSAVSGIVERVKGILAAPRSEWPVIAAEPASISGLYTGYIMWLAAIPAVSGFIKGSLIGYRFFGVSSTTPILGGLVAMVVGYVLGLAVLHVMALIVNALAPSFGGRKDQVQALKTVGYAWTAAWVAGIAVILPFLGPLLALAGGIYSIWLLYLGLPHTMKSPPEKSLAYTAVSVIIAIVLSLLLSAVVAGIGGAGLLGAGALGAGSSQLPARTVSESSGRLGQLAEMGRRMEVAGERLEQARASGDSEAEGRALGAMLGAMTGAVGADGEPVEAVEPDALRALLPENVGSWRRSSVSASRSGAMGMQMSEATAEYIAPDGTSRISVDIRDMAALSGMMAMAGAFGVEQSTETDSGFERTYTRDGRLITEEWDSGANRGKYSVVVGNRFHIEASGQASGIDELKRIVDGLDGQVARM